MAKQLKAIKCPQCGSTDKTAVKPDHFRCNNCNTEYFLDNDDITIHHRHHREGFDYAPPATPPPAAGKVLKKAFSVLIIVVALLWITSFALQRTFSGRTAGSGFIRPDEEEFHWFFNDKAAYISPEGKPVEVVVGERMYMGSQHETKKGVYAAFYDLQSGKELKAEKVPGISGDVSGGKYAAVTFQNGDLYFIVEKTKILRVNPGSLSLTDVTQSLFAQHPELTSGIANAEVIYKSDGAGFNLIANDGVNYYYYPLQDKLYTKEEKSAAEAALDAEKPGEPTLLQFAFSRKSTDFPEEKVQLIRYTRRDPQGGPDDEPVFEWTRNFGSGRPESKSLFHWEKGVVRNWKDFTPGRQYFDPKVLYSDNEVVLIGYANTPAEASARSLQCLNANTAEIIFTLPLSANYYLDEVLRYKGGFVINNNTSMLLVSPAGKLLTEFKTN